MAKSADISNRPILITGCSSGIGRVLATGLQARGYPVVASARRTQDVEDLAAIGLATVQLDLADPGSIQSGWQQAVDLTGGKLFALINNGAYGQPGAIEDLSGSALRAQFETNVFGTHQLTTLALPALRQSRGRLLQISSILGLVCLRYRGAYSASKYALEALADALRLELADSGVSVVLIEPGAIRTRFRANSYAAFQRYIDPEQSRHRVRYRATIRRLTQPEDVRLSLPPAAVLTTVIRALERPRPRPRYRVTGSAMLLAVCKRWLPDRWMDVFIQRLGG